MPIQIEIPDKKLAGFSDQAKTESNSVTQKYIDDLLREVNRLDLQRNPSGTPDINRNMVSLADQWVRTGYLKRHKPWWIYIIQVISMATSAISGYLFDIELLKNSLWLIVFVITLIIFVATSAYLLYKE
jgi:hypothetical protein